MKKKILAAAWILGIGVTVSAVAGETQEPDWLVYVYLCGSDLESGGGLATEDLAEMMEADLGENAVFLVQAGGTSEWDNEDLEAGKQNRLLITDGECYLMDTDLQADMGEASTLRDFLLWAQENELSAKKTGLILWNHGSGSINGVCFDETYDYDGLTLQELEEALEGMEPFDFIGFDACLMSTYEMADAIKDKASYMIASEELVSGAGLDYTQLGNQMGEDAKVTDLAKEVCDSFYESCEDIGQEDMATLSVTDLSKLDAFTEVFDKTAEKMKEGLADAESLGVISNAISKVENYGGNNQAEGYTNMIDLGHMLEQISDEIPEAAKAKEALDDMIVYQVKGEQRSHANGLSVYYPLMVQGSEEINTFSEINPSKSYVSFVQGMICGKITGTVEDYVEDYLEEEDPQSSAGFFEALFEDYEEGDMEYDSSIGFAEEMHLGEDGYYTFTLSEDSMPYVQSVHLNLFQYLEEDDRMYFLGVDNNVSWEDTVITENFEGIWPSLPDGQELMYYILEETPHYTLFTAPIELNGEERSLRFMWIWDSQDSDEGEYYVLGAWESLDEETGAASRDVRCIQEGDSIVPIYYGYSEETDEMEEYLGEEFIAGEELWIEDEVLREGYYEYAFEVTDIFGQSVMTDFADFYVDGEGNVELM